MWADINGQKEVQRNLIEAYKITTGKEAVHSERFFELEPSTARQRYELFKKPNGILRQNALVQEL